MPYCAQIQGERFTFTGLRELLAKASPARSADELAGIAAQSERQRAAAQIALAQVPLKHFLTDFVIPPESDEITRLILKQHSMELFSSISHFTVGELRDWLLSNEVRAEQLRRIRFALTAEMVAAVSKLMRIQDLISVAHKCEVITSFRNTLGLKGRLSTRLQPNHPTDDPKGVLVSVLDGLLLGSGDAVIGINPASDHPERIGELLLLFDEMRLRFEIPTQSCVLTHVTSSIDAIASGYPVDLVFQSIAGSQKANEAFGFNLQTLREAHQAALELKRGTVGNQCMYFETGQGSALSSDAHFGVDAQTMEVRAYAVAREFDPLLVNTVVGFIGPEYLFNGKQIIRAGLEDHFSGKLLGLPMGCDICYTNHTEADQDDMDVLLTLLGSAGCNYIMGVPGTDDIMLNYQSTSFHDALYCRNLLGLKPAPEFEEWLMRMKIWDSEKNQLFDPSHTQAQLKTQLQWIHSQIGL
ncbi:MAG: ethanolamine ammonia-lyase subunit EutB [Bdellovibrionia bacterium]